MFDISKKSKIIIAITLDSMSDRCDKVYELVTKICQIFEDISSIKLITGLMITKCDNDIDVNSIRNFIEKLKKDRINKLTESEIEFFDHFINE